MPELDLGQAVRACQSDAEFLAGLAGIYRQVDQVVAAAGPRCLGGGACCKFDLWDHRLFVTLGELALLAQDRPADVGRLKRRRCPWQDGPSCAAHPRRPLGCRLFFCKLPEGKLPGDAPEEFHRRIARLHQRRGLPYVYGDVIELALRLLAEK